MSDVGNSKRPIIIKRKKVIAASHHGGAWKVAYADFVTAMMAFFLLMWLLGATNEKQRKAIADYFNPTITINRNSGGGGSFFGGDSPFPEESLPHNGVIAGGISAEGNATNITRGVPTSGTIPAGGRVEREIDFDFSTLSRMRLALRTPDFTTAERTERAINNEFGRRVAQMMDAGTVQIDIGATKMTSAAHAIGRIENVHVNPQRKARVVVDQRSGTIVMGEDVRISRVAVSQGNLTIRIQELLLLYNQTHSPEAKK